ncbi:Uncharacterised protein [Vibrio cholerae]|uniref:Uncharacterized protein n=1 Tax=Vibrio cholerae TaxID=666 RepID=A0A655Q9E3_VIBCL|nr:Uncharacterised protein [Vibrio cholerae]CSB17733.1 Uncharacterised protein [Vibrio cholerae]CSB50713.1 Uncharacterised protein [Vibrio cholerae]CSB65751.1 Uncharacterised protein [Vibrio cholerae]CSC17579.1 Uncharacterised protein [Vibrio cholerae]
MLRSVPHPLMILKSSFHGRKVVCDCRLRHLNQDDPIRLGSMTGDDEQSSAQQPDAMPNLVRRD